MRIHLAFAALAVLSYATLGCSPMKVEPYTYDAETDVHAEFSGDKAMVLVEEFVEFGPHPSGSEANKKVMAWIEERLAAHGWETQRQTFTDPTPIGDVEFSNIRARFPAPNETKADWEAGGHVLLGSHFDTKLYTDFEFVGANDGGSSTGSLIEMARCLAMNPALAANIELVFFDGEECFVEYSATDGLYGSRHYTSQLRTADKATWPQALILLDMIGDAKLLVRVPPNGSGALLSKLFRASKQLDVRGYFGQHSTPILDDHEPFNALKIPAIDVIDIDYDPWHTAEDTIDKLSPKSLEIVCRTVLLTVEKYVLGGFE